jgi:hypothetical protein
MLIKQIKLDKIKHLMKHSNQVKFTNMNVFNITKNTWENLELKKSMQLRFTSSSRNLINVPKKFIYYDHLDLERNLDFVFNLGYNDYSNKIKPNMGLYKVLNYSCKRQLIYMMKHFYKNLLLSIESGEVEIFDEILEKNLKHSLFLDLKELYGKNYFFRVVNKDDPIFIRFLNIFELNDVHLDRELNSEISEYELKLKGHQIEIRKEDPLEEFRHQLPGDFKKEKEAFEQSEYKELALERLESELRISYAVEYLRRKLGSHKINEKNTEYITNIIKQLEDNDTKTDFYKEELKSQFADYYQGKEKYILEKLRESDTYIFFRKNMTSHYKSFYTDYNNKKSLLKRFIGHLRKSIYIRNSKRSKKISSAKTLYVVEVEISSKMRLELLDEEGKNALVSKYNYERKIKRLINNKSDRDYDSSLYKITLPEKRWNINHPEYMQSHVVRFEFEKKNIFQNFFKNSYSHMRITDIDLCLKGNKHFKFKKEYLDN